LTKQIAISHQNFNKMMQARFSKHQAGQMKNARGLLKGFQELYETNRDDSQEHPVVLMLHALVAQLEGQRTIYYLEKLMALHVMFQASDPKTGELICAQLPSPGTRRIQQVNATLRQKTPIICCEKDEIKARINEVLDMHEAAGIVNPSTSAAVDGTANAPVKECSVAHGAILGGACPHHFISIPKGQEMATIKAKLADPSIATAQEVKGFILLFQQMPRGMPQFILLVARLQGKNEVSNFNLLVCEALAESKRINFISCAVDRVS
jgi:hypothetical protein